MPASRVLPQMWCTWTQQRRLETLRTEASAAKTRFFAGNISSSKLDVAFASSLITPTVPLPFLTLAPTKELRVVHIKSP